MVRVGVIGCGNIGRVHAMSIKGLKGVSLCAVADIRMERAKEFSDCFTEGMAAVYGSLEEMLEKEALDVVHICTPHNCHVPMTVMVLKKGISAFMEKPPAITRTQFDELLEAEKESSGRLGICFQNRYNETTKKVSQILAEGTLGKLKGGRAFVTWNRGSAYYTESGWRGDLSTEGGGVLINQSIHTLDLMLNWLGKPVKTEAAMSNHHLKGVIGVEDTMEAYMEFTEGEDPVRASFYATTAYGFDAPVLMELVCEEGVVRLEGNSVFYRTWEQEDFVSWKAPSALVPGKSYWGCGHEACIQDYYKCLADGTAYPNDLPSVKTTFYTMMDIYDSARNKER